jgi:ABC-type amino acid transport substrate-binding protein
MLVMVSILASGCGSQGGGPSQTAAPLDTRIKDIQDRGTLRVGLIIEAPWAVKDTETGEWRGVSVDIMQYVADQLEVELEPVETDWSRVVPDVVADKIDVAAPGLYATPARAQVVWFTKPYAELGQIFVVSGERDDLQTVDDLNSSDITVAVNPGSITVDVANLFLPNAEQRTVTTMGTSAFMAEVLAGRADTFGLDNIKGPAFKEAYPEIKTIPEDWRDAVFKSPIAFAIQNNQPDFLQFLDVCIENLELSGELDRIYQEWLRSDYMLQ